MQPCLYDVLRGIRLCQAALAGIRRELVVHGARRLALLDVKNSRHRRRQLLWRTTTLDALGEGSADVSSNTGCIRVGNNNAPCAPSAPVV